MLFKTTVRTPQFKNGKPFEFVVQHGWIDDVTWCFTPEYKISGSVGMHEILFWTEEKYLLFRVDENN